MHRRSFVSLLGCAVVAPFWWLKTKLSKPKAPEEKLFLQSGQFSSTFNDNETLVGTAPEKVTRPCLAGCGREYRPSRGTITVRVFGYTAGDATKEDSEDLDICSNVNSDAGFEGFCSTECRDWWGRHTELMAEWLDMMRGRRGEES